MADNEVLKATTEVKIQELRRHEGELSKRYDEVDRTLESVRGDVVDRLRAVYQGVNGLEIVQERMHNDLSDLPDLLAFGGVDKDSVKDVLGLRAESIEREMACRRELWQHNKLLGELLMETVRDDEKVETGQLEALAQDEDWSMEEAEPTAKKDMPLETQRQDAQKRIEDYFFKPCGLERQRVREFLESDVFHRRASYSDDQWDKICKTLGDVRNAVKTFCASFVKKRIDASDVALLGKVLLVDRNEFSPEAVKLLENAAQNTVVQNELAHVLTIKLSNLSEFQWPANGVPVVMKRAINGRYRSLIQEGAIPFLLFQYIGLSWSIFIKEQLSKLLKCVDFERDEFYQSGSVNSTRISLRDRFLLTALPDEMDSSNDYDGDAWGDEKDKPPPKATKLDVLRLVCTEAHLANTLRSGGERRSVLAVVTDLEFFGPSVSHEVVLGIMEFLGVTVTWLQVFETHMKVPLRFPGSDAPRELAKGVPTSRRSSRFYSELVLFTMDFAVMATSGVFLYRTHDDILFFGQDDAKVLSAWQEMNQITDRFGLRLNEEKSGSVRLCCADKNEINESAAVKTSVSFRPEPLPQKPIRWGLIELQSDATVKIVEEQVDWFAWELAQKLAKAKSVLRWVTVYNKYMRFFLRNFGTVSPVFGLAHADNIVEHIKHIHKIAFPTTLGDVRAALIEKIASNHPELMREKPAALPAAWVYWPLELGGLGLFHPLLEIWSFRQTLQDEENEREPNHKRPFAGPREKMQQFYNKFADKVKREGWNAAIRAMYNRYAKRENVFEIVKSPTYSETSPPLASAWDETSTTSTYALRSFEDYADRLVMFNSLISSDYTYLLQPTDVEDHASYDDARSSMREVLGSIELPNEAYWMWVVYFYHRELQHVFGTTSLVPSKLLPAQLIGEIKKAGVYWT